MQTQRQYNYELPSEVLSRLSVLATDVFADDDMPIPTLSFDFKSAPFFFFQHHCCERSISTDLITWEIARANIDEQTFKDQCYSFFNDEDCASQSYPCNSYRPFEYIQTIRGPATVHAIMCNCLLVIRLPYRGTVF